MRACVHAFVRAFVPVCARACVHEDERNSMALREGKERPSFVISPKV